MHQNIFITNFSLLLHSKIPPLIYDIYNRHLSPYMKFFAVTSFLISEKRRTSKIEENDHNKTWQSFLTLS